MNVSATSLSKLISTRKEELARLLEWRGTNFPVVERQNDLRISFIELELEDLEKLNAQPQLNENQQIVLGQLKINAGSNGSLIKAIHSLFNLLTISSNQLEKDCTEGLLKSKNALARLTRKQAAEVLSAFAKWALEQEEE